VKKILITSLLLCALSAQAQSYNSGTDDSTSIGNAGAPAITALTTQLKTQPNNLCFTQILTNWGGGLNVGSTYNPSMGGSWGGQWINGWWGSYISDYPYSDYYYLCPSQNGVGNVQWPAPWSYWVYQ
jgi:hypothetical protein